LPASYPAHQGSSILLFPPFPQPALVYSQLADLQLVFYSVSFIWQAQIFHLFFW
jgi:hypothetical protein